MVPRHFHRPGLIGPHTCTGSANRSDWLMRFLRCTVKMGCIRVAHDEGSVEDTALTLTPVDHAAELIVDGMLDPRATDTATPASTASTLHTVPDVSVLPGDDTACYHIPLTVSMPTAAFVQLFVEACEKLGRPMHACGDAERTLASLPATSPLLPFKPQFEQGQ